MVDMKRVFVLYFEFSRRTGFSEIKKNTHPRLTMAPHTIENEVSSGEQTWTLNQPLSQADPEVISKHEKNN